MTNRDTNPLASGEDADGATGVDGSSDDWAKAVVDGLRADDARSEGARPTEARADTAGVVEDDSSTFAPVADRPDGHGIAGLNLDDAVAAPVEVDRQPSTDGDPVCGDAVSSDVAEADAGTSDEVSGADELGAELGLDGGEMPPPPQGPKLASGSVEDLVSDLERVTGERDNYLESSRRIQAEFENYRKQVGKRETEARERANESLVAEMLPVLDACDGAIANGAEDVVPIGSSLVDALTKQGLERINPTDKPFDPEFHEAVMHEDGDGDGGPVVAEVLRAGYTWKGRVIRPAMVRVRG